MDADHDEDLAAYIASCDEALEAAMKRPDWPSFVVLPAPPKPLHRDALHHWLDEVHQKLGRRIRVDFDPPYGTASPRKGRARRDEEPAD
jgi:hypothetical protein